MSSRKYNHIYQLLVLGDDDLIGQVAYSLYKKEKCAWGSRFIEENGAEPSDDDVALFHCFTCSEENKIRFRLQAKNIVLNTIDAVTSENIRRAREELNRNHRTQLLAIVEPLRTSFWMGVLQGVIASFVFSLLIVLFITIAKWGGIDFGAFLDWLK